MPQFNAIKLEIEVASEIVAGPEIKATLNCDLHTCRWLQVTVQYIMSVMSQTSHVFRLVAKKPEIPIGPSQLLEKSRTELVEINSSTQ